MHKLHRFPSYVLPNERQNGISCTQPTQDAGALDFILVHFVVQNYSNTYGIHSRHGSQLVAMLDSTEHQHEEQLPHSALTRRRHTHTTHTCTHFVCTYFMATKLKCNSKGIRRWKNRGEKSVGAAHYKHSKR